MAFMVTFHDGTYQEFDDDGVCSINENSGALTLAFQGATAVYSPSAWHSVAGVPLTEAGDSTT